MRNVDLVGVRPHVLIGHRHGTQRRVVASIPRAGNGEDKPTALSTVGTRLAEPGAGIAGVGYGRSSADIVGDIRVVVGHEIDLHITARGRVDPVDGNLRAGHPVDDALVEVAGRVVDDEFRVWVLVLADSEVWRGNSSQSWGGENGRDDQQVCERSHIEKSEA